MVLSASIDSLIHDANYFIGETRSVITIASHRPADPTKVYSNYNRITDLFHGTLDTLNRNIGISRHRRTKKRLIHKATQVTHAHQRVLTYISIFRKASSMPPPAPGLFSKKRELGPSSDLFERSSRPLRTTLQSEAGATASAASSSQANEPLFEPTEILYQDPIYEIRPLVLEDRQFLVSYTEDKRSILLQVTLEGCTAACAAMLILDHGKSPNITALTTRYASSYEIPAADISHTGLTPVFTPVAMLKGSLKNLREALMKNGPALIYIQKNTTWEIGHVVVVDAISEDLCSVKLRDPWDGWSITVKAEAFARYWNYFNECYPECYPENQIIQVRD